MPVIGTPANAQTTPATGSALAEYAKAQLASVGSVLVNTVSPQIQELHQLRVIKSKPVSTKGAYKPPWMVSGPEGDTFTVFKDPLPDGCVVTHVLVSETVGYRPAPISEVTPVSLTMAIQAQMERVRIGGKTQGPSMYVLQEMYTASAKKDFEAHAPAAKKALELANAKLESTKGTKTNLSTVRSETNSSVASMLDLAGEQKGMANLRMKVGRVFLGQKEPIRAEVRIVLHDVLTNQSDGTLGLVMDRWQLLDLVHALFCSNSTEKADYNKAYTVLADAARITASAVAGHLVEVSSPGLDPYRVQKWLVADFQHQEVPDLDVIAVRIKLVEYLSVLDASIEDPRTAPSINKTLPAENPTRPTYSQLYSDFSTDGTPR